jgi:hypothetical protein
MKPALSELDAAAFAAMPAKGGFRGACERITRIDLNASSKSDEIQNAKSGESKAWWPSGAPKTCGAVLAVIRAGGREQAQLWVFDVAGEGKTISKQVFHSYYQPMDIVQKLSGSAPRGTWASIVAAEIAAASVAEETPEPPARVEEQEQAEDAPPNTAGPMGMPPMRNRPKPGSIDPPRHMPGNK